MFAAEFLELTTRHQETKRRVRVNTALSTTEALARIKALEKKK